MSVGDVDRLLEDPAVDLERERAGHLAQSAQARHLEELVLGFLKLLLAQGGTQREGVWFSAADREIPPVVDVAFQIKRNTFFNDGRSDLMIQDIRAAS